jgi:hypothetical protein
MKVNKFFCSAFLALLGFSATAQAASLLTASAERATAGERPATASIANVVVRSVNKNDLNYLDSCMRDLNIPQGAYERLFRVVQLPRLRNGQLWYFVRPALNPYCQAFYGANGFRHWLVSTTGAAGAVNAGAYQVRYTGLASDFRVFNTLTNGYYDIAASNCTAAECFNTQLKYVGNRYAAAQCSETRFSGGSGNDVETVVACRSR